MFPMREWLPENVKLELLDVLAETMPEELVGAFDVVHIRAFVCVIKGGDPSRVMERMVAMLSEWFFFLLVVAISRFVCSLSSCENLSCISITRFSESAQRI